MPTKQTTRRTAAVALGVVGVLGLSLAAASTLNLTTDNEIAIGSGTFAPCDDDGVHVGYDYAKVGGDYVITDVVVSDIAAACDGEAITVALDDAAGASLFAETDVVSGTTFTYDATGDAIPVATDLGDVTVVISD